MPKDRSQTLLSIQYLRAIAASMVIPPHIAWTNQLWGTQGVDIFFVISGFIMVYVSKRGPSPREFIRSRLIRIVPLYWMVTLVAAALTLPSWKQLFLSLLFIPYLQSNGIYPVVLQGWTLVYEMFFYGIFAACLLLKPRYRLIALTGVLLCLVGIGCVEKPQSPAGQTYLNPLLLEFACGCWLYKVYEAGLLKRKPAFGMTTLGLGVIGLITFASFPPDQWRALMWGLPAILIVTGSISLESRLRRYDSLLLIGSASYSIYLTHYLFLAILKSAAHPLPLPFAILAIVACCIALGIVVHVFVEVPIANLLKARKPKFGRNAILAPP